jgi:hypothetical protein
MVNKTHSFINSILTEILKWTCTKQWRCSHLLRHKGQILDNVKKFLSIKVIKIVLDSMLYEMAPDRTILHLVKRKSQTSSPSQELWRAHYYWPFFATTEHSECCRIFDAQYLYINYLSTGNITHQD